MVLLLSMVILGGLLAALAAGLILAERRLLACGPCRIDINGGERAVTVAGGRTLMATLAAEEIFIPAGCGGRGICGRCKVVVLAGGGRVGPTETPYLTRVEIRAGCRLACQVKVRQDMVLRVSEEILNVRMYAATVVATRELTREIKEIRLQLDVPAHMPRRAGQYVQVEAPGGGAETEFRAYSIASPAEQTSLVDLVVRLVPGGLGSTYLHRLVPGDVVRFTGPYGQWRLDDDPAVELVCVAGGVGVAPIRSIVRSILDAESRRICRLFVGCRTTADALYLAEFERLAVEHDNLHVVYALSAPGSADAAWTGATGFIHLSVDEHLAPGPRRQAYLCGPSAMVEAVTAVLHAKGVSDDAIFWDEF